MDIFIGSIRKRESNTDTSARTIFERALDQQKDKTPNYVLAEINEERVQRNIRRYRKNALEEPPIPETLDELIIREPYLRHHNEIIIKFDGYDEENNRHLIVTTEELLDKLREYVEWGADGTLFDVVRSLFHQVWIIFVRIGTTYVPCVYCFMSAKTQIAYKFLLAQIQRMRPTAKPTAIATDFEMAEMNAFQHVYPAIQHKACFFHFAKNLFKRVIDSGLLDRYENEKGFKHEVKMIFALPFVPVNDLERAFEVLYNITDPALEQIIASLERTYFGRMHDDVRNMPRYPPYKWNLHERVKNSEPRSNNGIEAYNNQLVRKAVESRPNIWHWIRIIKEELSLAEHKIDEFQGGQPAPRRRSNYRIMDDRLRECVTRYNVAQLEHFLRNIANHLRLDTIV
ncbi:MULE transposase domain-containing protein [Ditylenchus destructor]|uniref:MULE transposase domain-containing protein n=1 Tax=Ditylenchus destructor TaxID=166010 RepID=A0AAD4MZD6_9BILA|nr:MULE transposase domain-containing protein [Ditylenchus destructor]